MKTFEAGKTIKELGIDTTRKFVVVNGDEVFTKGSILTLSRDDNSSSPFFENQDGIKDCMHLRNLAYYEEKPKEEMKEGDYVYVSNVSEEDALEYCRKRTLLRKCSNGVVCISDAWELEYLKGDIFGTERWCYGVPIPQTKTITFEVTEEQEREINNIFKK